MDSKSEKATKGGTAVMAAYRKKARWMNGRARTAGEDTQTTTCQGKEVKR